MQTQEFKQNSAASPAPQPFLPFSAHVSDSFKEAASGPHGSQKAKRDALVVEHMPAVRFIARRIAERLPQHVELDDLISAGLVGLLDAASRFDLGKQVQFKSYAQFRIRGAIMDSLRSLDWSPRELRRQDREMEEALHTLSSKLGRTPSDSELAEEMGLSLALLHQLTGELKNTVVGSLDVEYNESEGGVETAAVPADAKQDPLFCCIAGQTREHLAAAIDMLPERERLVLTLSYFEEMTLKEIGFTLGVVESRVSQLRSAAIARLRVHLKTRVRRSPAKGGVGKAH